MAIVARMNAESKQDEKYGSKRRWTIYFRVGPTADISLVIKKIQEKIENNINGCTFFDDYNFNEYELDDIRQCEREQALTELEIYLPILQNQVRNYESQTKLCRLKQDVRRHTIFIVIDQKLRDKFHDIEPAISPARWNWFAFTLSSVTISILLVSAGLFIYVSETKTSNSPLSQSREATANQSPKPTSSTAQAPSAAEAWSPPLQLFPPTAPLPPPPPSLAPPTVSQTTPPPTEAQVPPTVPLAPTVQPPPAEQTSQAAEPTTPLPAEQTSRPAEPTTPPPPEPMAPPASRRSSSSLSSALEPSSGASPTIWGLDTTTVAQVLPSPLGKSEEPSHALDLLVKHNAARVQERLRALHYLRGREYDSGTWGATSRAALREFRLAERLGPDDQWDAATEDVLLSPHTPPATVGSAESGPLELQGAGIGADFVFLPPPGAKRNPLNQDDALWIQNRLRKLGFYLYPSAGVWDKRSRELSAQL